MDINKIIIYYFYYLTFALEKLHEINDFYLYIIYFVMFGNICCRDFIYEFYYLNYYLINIFSLFSYE